MLAFFAAIPVWVLPLALLLGYLGHRARKDRTSSVKVLCALPFLGLASIGTAFELGLVALITLAIGRILGTGLGLKLQPRWTIARDATHVRLRGEGVTFVKIISLFALNFLGAALIGIVPDLTQSFPLAVAYGLSTGLLSGVFAGRALYVLRLPHACNLPQDKAPIAAQGVTRGDWRALALGGARVKPGLIAGLKG